MDIEIKTWLHDMMMSIREIDGFFPDKPKMFLLYESDLKTRRAVERNIEIIGEAMKRILSKYPQFSLLNARKIVNTRNRIIHGYDTVSNDYVWEIVINHLPKLKEDITALLPDENV